MFLRNVSWLSTDYTEWYHRRQNSLHSNQFQIAIRVILVYIPFLRYEIKRLLSSCSLYICVPLFKFELPPIKTADMKTFPLALCLIAIVDEKFQQDMWTFVPRQIIEIYYMWNNFYSSTIAAVLRTLQVISSKFNVGRICTYVINSSK
jgi:hypothetical protein